MSTNENSNGNANNNYNGSVFNLIIQLIECAHTETIDMRKGEMKEEYVNQHGRKVIHI